MGKGAALAEKYEAALQAVRDARAALAAAETRLAEANRAMLDFIDRGITNR